jgi:predicted nucleic acid-binding protein
MATPHYFMDSSAVVKRYVDEVGSAWIRRLCEARDPETDHKSNAVLIAEITRVEVAAAIARRVKKTKELDESEGDDAYGLFLEHAEDDYQIVPITPALVRSAAQLARRYALRAYDAVQLATALHSNNLLKANGLSLTFVAGDETLLRAAQVEGMAADNPFDHAELDTAE